MDQSGSRLPRPAVAAVSELCRRWRWRALVALILAAGAAAAGVALCRPAPKELAVQGSAAAMGKACGQATRLRVRLLCRRYLRAGQCGGREEVYRQRLANAEARLSSWPQPYRDELVALAAAAGVPAGALSYANSLLDGGGWRAGCRSLVVADNGLLRHAHNLDWSDLGGLARWSVVVVRRQPDDGRLRTVAVGFPGLVGALDIINERGIALSFNQMGMGDGHFTEPIFVTLRRIADRCTSFAEARQELLGAPAGAPFIVTLSDAGGGQAAVFERRREVITERPLADGWVAATNASQGETRDGTLLDDLLAQSSRRSVADIEAVLRHRDVLMDCNLYSVIWDFRANRFHLASGTVPAAAGRYRTYRLF